MSRVYACVKRAWQTVLDSYRTPARARRVEMPRWLQRQPNARRDFDLGSTRLRPRPSTTAAGTGRPGLSSPERNARGHRRGRAEEALFVPTRLGIPYPAKKTAEVRCEDRPLSRGPRVPQTKRIGLGKCARPQERRTHAASTRARGARARARAGRSRRISGKAGAGPGGEFRARRRRAAPTRRVPRRPRALGPAAGGGGGAAGATTAAASTAAAPTATPSIARSAASTGGGGGGGSTRGFAFAAFFAGRGVSVCATAGRRRCWLCGRRLFGLRCLGRRRSC